jgi:hypothetical protein
MSLARAQTLHDISVLCYFLRRHNVGFSILRQNLFSHNIVTDVTDDHYVRITVVTTKQKLAKLRYEIITRNRKEL